MNGAINQDKLAWVLTPGDFESRKVNCKEAVHLSQGEV